MIASQIAGILIGLTICIVAWWLNEWRLDRQHIKRMRELEEMTAAVLADLRRKRG